MQRKYIYIIVFILTIALVWADQYFGLFTNNNQKPAEQLSEEIKDNYNAAEIKYSLVLKNYQNDDSIMSYTYKIKIDNYVGAQLYSYKGVDDYIVFAANGEAQLNLNSNETLILTDIQEGSKYLIEQLTDVSDKYTTSVNQKATKIVEGTIGSENTIEFKNETIKPQTPPVTENSGNNDIKPNDKEETPSEEENDNPFTSDNHYLVLGVFIYASLLLFIALKFRIKRFG